MNKNVVMLTGINGTGKSALTKMLHESFPDSVSITASEVLMDVLGGVNRQVLENMPLAEKMCLKIPALIRLFKLHKLSRYIFLDAHLVIPIRKNGTVIMQNVWSPKFMPYINRAYCIISDPQNIMDWRLKDYNKTGRERDTNINNIKKDQLVNLRAFKEIIFPVVNSKIVVNKNDNAKSAFDIIRNDLPLEKKLKNLRYPGDIVLSRSNVK